MQIREETLVRDLSLEKAIRFFCQCADRLGLVLEFGFFEALGELLEVKLKVGKVFAFQEV